MKTVYEKFYEYFAEHRYKTTQISREEFYELIDNIKDTLDKRTKNI